MSHLDATIAEWGKKSGERIDSEIVYMGIGTAPISKRQVVTIQYADGRTLTRPVESYRDGCKVLISYCDVVWG